MQDHGYYVLLWQAPDTKRISIMNSIWAKTEKEFAFVYDAGRRVVMMNPDVTIDPTTFLQGPFRSPAEYRPVVEKLEAELKAADPNRISVKELQEAGALDHGQRLLHDPEIARMLAARKTAVSADAPAHAPESA